MGGHVAPGVHLAGNVIIEEGAFLGVGMSVTPGIKGVPARWNKE